MKKLNGILGPLILAVAMWSVAIIVGTLPITQGCTAPQQRVTYNTLYSSHLSADATFSAYMGAVLQGTAPTNGVPAAGRAYREFQAAFDLALRTALFNTNAPSPQPVNDALSKLVTATTH